jgi:hypothetical protein
MRTDHFLLCKTVIDRISDMFQKHSYDCQMSCSIWVYWQDWTRLARELLPRLWCESTVNKKNMVER